jgi:hypothetical protein
MRFRSRKTGLVAISVSAWLTLSAAARPQDADRDKSGPKPRAAAAADWVSPALGQAIRGKAPLGDVRIDLVWKSQPHQIYGDGVGIWNHTVQYPVTRSEIMELLKAISREHFGSLPDTFGEADDDEAEKKGHIERSAVEGRLSVSIGPRTKAVTQFWNGEQSKAFEKLALQILKVSEAGSKTGVHVASVQEGLQMIAAGKLAPQALEIVVQRKVDRPATGGDREGWTLFLTGRRANVATLPKGGPPENSRMWYLPAKDFEKLVASLAADQPAALPQSLWAPQYTDFRIRILNNNRYVNARPFAGMTPTTNGPEQEKFNRIYEQFHAVYLRAQKDGEPIADPRFVAPSAETEEEKEKEKEKEKD